MPDITFAPDLPEAPAKLVRKKCIRLLKELKSCGNNIHQIRDTVVRFRADLRPVGSNPTVNDLKALTCLNVIADLVAHGWTLSLRSQDRIRLVMDDSGDDVRSKEQVRNRHLLERDDQLRESSVREFINGMERRRLTKGGWHSIFSLMRDGRQLFQQLESINSTNDEIERAVKLSETIRPYLQFVHNGEVCEHTGLLLSDIWRYFRHTWVNAYRSVPGRSMMILVRDAAAPYHPIIGIAALGSAVVQQSVRDEWIGWDSKRSLERLLTLSPQRLTKWTFRQIEDFLEGIYVRDLVRLGVIARREITNPTSEAVARLRAEAAKAIAEHREHPEKSIHKTVKDDKRMSLSDWQMRAETSLFRAKRSKVLSDLLEMRRIITGAFAGAETHGEYEKVLERRDVRNVVSRLSRLRKGERVGINIMDITVCGAVAPYNAMLGGKLMCLLLCSPEVGEAYTDRYAEQPSLIASCMKGAPVVRRSRLVVLGTTSLYGHGSSQYNRLKVPTECLTGAPGKVLEYKNLGLSVGYGSFHLSTDTVDVMTVLLGRVSGGRRVNSIFGEGVNPLMRKIREALDIVGMPSEDILLHGNQRIVYGVALASNLQDFFLGLDKNPKYLLPQSDPQGASQQLAAFWRTRWLTPRITRPDVLEQVASHRVDFPVIHGARVNLPFDESDDQRLLFAASR
jgi:hypothetical protein